MRPHLSVLTVLLLAMTACSAPPRPPGAFVAPRTTAAQSAADRQRNAAVVSLCHIGLAPDRLAACHESVRGKTTAEIRSMEARIRREDEARRAARIQADREEAAAIAQVAKNARLAKERRKQARTDALLSLLWRGPAGGHQPRDLGIDCSNIVVDRPCVLATLDSEICVHAEGGETLLGTKMDVSQLEGLAIKPLRFACDLEKFRSDPAAAAAMLVCGSIDGKTPDRVQRLVERHVQQMRNYRSDEGFGKSRWGMTPGEVRKRERVRPKGADLIGNLRVAGLDGTTRFTFHDERLVAVTAKFSQRLGAGALNEFFQLRDLLTRRYGVPVDMLESPSGEVEAVEAIAQRDRTDLAYSIHQGDRDLTASFATDETLVELRVSSRKRWLGTQISYASRALIRWHRAEIEKRYQREARKL